MRASDPMVWGDVQRTVSPLTHNGETAVFVQAVDDGEAVAAVDILKIYDPVAIETMPLAE
jgi:hypothetical protein